MSLLRRAARRLRLGQYRFHQGDDLEGREYFETLDGNVPGRTKRFVRYPGRTGGEPYEYIGESLPVQWEGWLRHSRRDPPTLDELTADLARKQRVATNVARLAEQYRLEKARQPQLPPAAAPSPAPVATPTVPPDPVELPSETARRRAVAERRAAAAQARADSSAPPAADAPAAVGGDAFQPQAWAPQARRRGRSAAS